VLSSAQRRHGEHRVEGGGIFVSEVRQVTNRGSGQSKGVASIEWSTDEAASNAIAGLIGTLLGDGTLTVNEARPHPEGPSLLAEEFIEYQQQLVLAVKRPTRCGATRLTHVQAPGARLLLVRAGDDARPRPEAEGRGGIPPIPVQLVRHLEDSRQFRSGGLLQRLSEVVEYALLLGSAMCLRLRNELCQPFCILHAAPPVRSSRASSPSGGHSLALPAHTYGAGTMRAKGRCALREPSSPPLSWRWRHASLGGSS
jgi:hypothetical protein